MAAILLLPRAEAKGFATTAFVQPNDLVAFQGFGGGVAADGSTMAVGVQHSPFAVYVYGYNNGTWTEEARLTSPTGNDADRFGSSLAVQGDTLVIGAGGARVAYVYTKVNGAWVASAVLTPAGGTGASFGGSAVDGVAIDGATIAVGAPAEPTALGNTGSVYVFTNVGGFWTQQQRIVPADPLTADFGESVALQKDTLLVGAPFTPVAGQFGGGAALVYGRSNGVWTLSAQLASAAPAPRRLYGFCVSLDGTTAVVGAPGTSEAEIFVNANGTWSLQALIPGPDDSDFGTALKVTGDRLMIAAYDDVSPLGIQSGDAFVFARGGSTWTEQQDLYMAPGVNGIPGPGQGLQRFGNFGTMTRLGSQTIFVFGSQTYSNSDARQVGAVYTATLN